MKVVVTTQLKRHFLNRLERLVWMVKEVLPVLGDEKLEKTVRRLLFATYLDCVSVGEREEARKKLEPLGIDFDTNLEAWEAMKRGKSA